MIHTSRAAMLLIALSMVPLPVHAGWVTMWTNTAVKQNGDRMDPQNASMTISSGRVRLVQPEVVTLIDYNADRFTLINPTKQYFWTGTIDQYQREMGRARALKMREQFGEIGKGKAAPQTGEYKVPKIDPAKLPPLSINKTGLTEKIAGYDTEKYEIKADGELFQEIWVAPTMDVSGDLDPNRYFAVQRKMTAAMIGKSAGQYNALYLNDEYRKLIEKAFVLKIVTHHMGGSFERFATSVSEAEVPTSQFEVPEAYRKVRLSDVLSEPKPN
jgi:Domain of unknown function (DUF4412)